MTQDSEALPPEALPEALPSDTSAPEADSRFDHAAFWRSKPLVALYTMLLLGGALELTPGLERHRLLRPVTDEREAVAAPASTASQVVGEAALSEESISVQPGTLEAERATTARGPIARPESGAEQPLEVETKPPPVSLEDPSGRALEAFFRRLSATRQRQLNAVTRIIHFGDSIVASDYVSSTLRRRFQEHFGDAGHGFSLVANAWPAYFHDGITRYATSGWLISRVVGPLAEDGWYGLGGVSFRAPPHLLTRIGTAKKGTVGRRVSRFEVAYVEAPNGGQADVRIDGKPQGVLDTNGAQKRFRTVTYAVTDGEHELELQTTRGTSRYFGVVLERDTPGVVLDAIGIQGARVRFLDKQDDEHYKEQLRWRDPALVIYQFGANESADGYAYSMNDYYETMRQVVRQQVTALPNSSCLILAAMDRASQKGNELKSLSIIPLLVEQQRKVAVSLGCAFFDTFSAMGGTGSMPKWVKRGLAQSDLTHPSAVGAEMIGEWIFRALMHAHRETAQATGLAPKAAE